MARAPECRPQQCQSRFKTTSVGLNVRGDGDAPGAPLQAGGRARMASWTQCRAGTVAFRASKCPISRQLTNWFRLRPYSLRRNLAAGRPVKHAPHRKILGNVLDVVLDSGHEQEVT